MSNHPRIAVVGGGQWGRNHVRTLAQMGALAAVCDHDAERATALAQMHGVPALAFDAIIADPTIAAIVLALPAEHNAALAAQALGAGKHLLVEKPIALTSADANAMVEAARVHDRVLMVGHILRYHNAFRALVAELDAGRIGAIKYIQSHRLGFGKFYDRFDALWDLAPHDLSLVLSLTGAAPASVKAARVSVTTGQTDTAHLHLGFEAGPTAHVHVSRHSVYGERRFVVTGQWGSLIWDDLMDWPGKLAFVPHTVRRGDNGEWSFDKGGPEPIDVTPGMALTDELAHFVDCVENGDAPLTPGQQGLDVVRILEAAEAA